MILTIPLTTLMAQYHPVCCTGRAAVQPLKELIYEVNQAEESHLFLG